MLIFKEKVPHNKVVEDLKAKFEMPYAANDQGSFIYKEGTTDIFNINHDDKPPALVRAILGNYFSTRVVQGGLCKLTESPRYTCFKIIDKTV